MFIDDGYLIICSSVYANCSAVTRTTKMAPEANTCRYIATYIHTYIVANYHYIRTYTHAYVIYMVQFKGNVTNTCGLWYVSNEPSAMVYLTSLQYQLQKLVMHIFAIVHIRMADKNVLH